MEQLKHECGVAMIRLIKPLEYYRDRYGTYSYGINKLYLLMEKQHNRGQEAAGVGVVKTKSLPGEEYVYRERALGTGAIDEIFSHIGHQIDQVQLESRDARWVERHAPFIGEVYMGHLRYSTTGKSGMSYVHPFLRRNNWRSRNLMLCGNFNMTNIEEIFQSIVERGMNPRLYSDTIMLLESLGYSIDKENHRLYRSYRDTLKEPELSRAIDSSIDLARVLGDAAPQWDGGYVMCGALGTGHTFTIRDPHGIRPAFYYADDEVVVVASERPVIQTTFGCKINDVKELHPGAALIVDHTGRWEEKQVLNPGDFSACSFERIYFSRGSDADIYHERKMLGYNLVPQLLELVGEDIDNTVFSFIPNTAEVAFLGMVEGLEKFLDDNRKDEIMRAQADGQLQERLPAIMARKLRVEKIAIKDIKLRTFIAEGTSRNDLAAHVYDVTYGCIANDRDTLVVIDDSIVRGTTLKQSILRILDRLHPRRIIVVSSSPQVRYPDYYGIDMSRLQEFVAFRAAISLLKQRNMSHIIDQTYQRCKEQLELPASSQENCVKAIYEPFTEDEISAEIARLLTPVNMHAEVHVVYQTIEGLHKSVPNHRGDWYFTGNYPTPGGIRLVNKALVNFVEHNDSRE